MSAIEMAGRSFEGLAPFVSGAQRSGRPTAAMGEADDIAGRVLTRAIGRRIRDFCSGSTWRLILAGTAT